MEIAQNPKKAASPSAPSRLLITILLSSIIVSASTWDLSSKANLIRTEKIDRSLPRSFQLTVQPKKLLYLNVKGFGYAIVTYLSPQTNKQVNLNCRSPSHVVCPLWNFDFGDEVAIPQSPVNISISAGSRNRNVDLDIEIIEGDEVEIGIHDHSHINLSELDNIDIRVNFQDLTQTNPPVLSTDPNNNEVYRLQFFALQGYQNWLNYHEELTMSVAQGKGIADLASGVKGVSTIGFGVVKTLVVGDQDYCITKVCEYSVRIRTSKVSSFKFVATVFKRLTDVYFQGSATIFDEIRDNFDTIYNYNNFMRNGVDWMWKLTPAVGDPDVHINGDTLPENLEDFRWKSNGDAEENIYISSKEMKESNLTGNHFYQRVTTTSRDSTYLLQVYTKRPGGMVFLKPNEPVSGIIQQGEVITYSFHLSTHMPETLTSFIKLHVESGNPDLYVKECSESEMVCEISLDEIKNSTQLEKDSNVYFRSSKNTQKDQSIYLRVNCVPSTDMNYNRINYSYNSSGNSSNPGNDIKHMFQNDYYTSKSCTFGIAVYGAQGSLGELPGSYTLVFQGFKHHDILQYDKPFDFRLNAKEKKYFLFSPPITNPKKIEKLQVTLTLLSGDALLFASSTSLFPSDLDSNSEWDRIIDNDENELGSSQTTIFITKNEATGYFSKQYYFTVESDELIFGDIKIQAIEYSKDPNPSSPIFFNIPSRSKVSKLIDSQSNQAFFFFNLDPLFFNNTKSNKTDIVEFTLSSFSIGGDIRICIKKNVKRILEFKDCDFVSYGEPITLSKDTLSYDRIGDFYGILVEPKFKVKSSTFSSIYFKLLLNTITAPILLENGVSNKIVVTSKKPWFFKYEIWNMDADSAIIIDSDSAVTLQASLDPLDPFFEKSEDQNPSLRKDLAKNAAIVYSKEEILKFSKMMAGDYMKDDEQVDEKQEEEEKLRNSSLKKRNHTHEADASQPLSSNSITVYIKVTPFIEESDFEISVNSGEPFKIKPNMYTSLPAPYESNIEAVTYNMVLSEGDMVINVYSPYYKIEVIAQVHYVNKTHTQDKLNKYFAVTDVNSVITIPSRVVVGKGLVIIKFQIKNLTAKTSKKNLKNDNLKDIDYSKRIYIEVKTGTSKLNSMMPLSGIVKKGEFQYYTLSLKPGDASLISLDVLQSGEADLYLGYQGKYPNLESFIQRSSTYLHDSLVINSQLDNDDSDRSSEEIDLQKFKNVKSRNYIIGVYGRQNTKYSIVAANNLPYQYIKVSTSQIYTRKIKKNQTLVIDFLGAKENQEFELGVSSNVQSTLKLQALYLDKDKSVDFLKSVSSESADWQKNVYSYNQIFKRTSFLPKKESQIQYIFKITPSQDITLSFFIDNLVTPLKITSDSLFTDMIEPFEERTYIYETPLDISNATLQVSLEEGEISVMTHPKALLPVTEWDKLPQGPIKNSSSQFYTLQVFGGNKPQKIINILNQDKNTSNDLGLFNRYFITIRSSTYSTYSLKIDSSQNSFKKLIPGLREPYYYHSKNPQSLYYVIDSKNKINKFEVLFHINDINLKNGNFEDIKDKYDLLNLLYFFIIPDQYSEFSKIDSIHKMPASVLSTTTRSYDRRERITLGFTFEVEEGIFLIQPKPQVEKELQYKFSVELVINDSRELSLNGQIQDTLNLYEEKLYLISVPSAGNLEINIEQCRGSVKQMQGESLEDSTNNTSATSGGFKKLNRLEDYDHHNKISFSKRGSYYIKLQGQKYGKEDKSTFVIETKFTAKGVSTLPSTFFFLQPEEGKNLIETSAKVFSNHVSVKIQKPQPMNGFWGQYPNVEKATIQFNLYLMSNESRPFHYKVCKPSSFIELYGQEVSMGSESYSVLPIKKSQQAQELMEFDWIGDQNFIEIAVQIPKELQAPFKGLITMSINLKGPYQDELSDDIQINGSQIIVFKNRPKQRMIFLVVLLVFVVAILLVAVALQFCVGKKKTGLSSSKRRIAREIESANNDMDLDDGGHRGFEMTDGKDTSTAIEDSINSLGINTNDSIETQDGLDEMEDTREQE